MLTPNACWSGEKRSQLHANQPTTMATQRNISGMHSTCALTNADHRCEWGACNKTFGSTRALCRHVLTHVASRVPCIVDKCKRTFDDRQTMMAHCAKRHDTQTVACVHPTCAFEACTEQELLGHVIATHGKVCAECGWETNQIALYHAHVRTHLLPSVPCTADGCGKQFVSEARRLQHWHVVHNQTFKCGITGCHQVSTSAGRLEQHMSSHRRQALQHTRCQGTDDATPPPPVGPLVNRGDDAFHTLTC